MAVFDLDHWQEIWASLAKNRGRTFLTAFGVFWGIFMLVLMRGSGNGLANGAEAGFAGSATNSFFVWTQRTSKPFRGLQPGRTFEMSNADTEAIRREVPEAAVVAPRNQLRGFGGGNNVTHGAKSGGFNVMGDVPEVFAVQALDMVAGRFLNPFDLAERRKVAVIGNRVREVLFAPDEDPLADSIEVNGVYFRVIGVFRSMQPGDEGDREAQTVFIPFTTFQTAFNYGDRVGWYAITSRPGVAAEEVEEKVLTLLRQRHRVAPDDLRALGSWNTQEQFDRVDGLFRGIAILVWIVGAGTLAAGVIGVSNIMLIIVKERTKEIGLRRAVGAPPTSIASQIVLEAVVLTAIAGYVGLVAGVAVVEGVRVAMDAAGVQAQMFKNPGIDLADAVKALGILVVSGALAGLIPAQRALAVSPVEALRAE